MNIATERVTIWIPLTKASDVELWCFLYLHLRRRLSRKSRRRWLVTPSRSLWHHSNVLITHLALEKMAAILADDNFKCIFLNENDRIPISISLNLFSGVQFTISHHWFRYWLGDVTHFTEAYMRHQGSCVSITVITRRSLASRIVTHKAFTGPITFKSGITIPPQTRHVYHDLAYSN